MRGLILAVALALAPCAALAQTLTVVGPDGKATEMTSDQLAALPRATANLNQGDAPTTYEGPTLTAILRAAGAPVGVKLHGKPLAAYVVVTGSDGYQAVLSIAETDPWFNIDPVIVADRRKDGPLAESEGNLRLIVGSDRRPERAVRMVVRIEVKPLN